MRERESVEARGRGRDGDTKSMKEEWREKGERKRKSSGRELRSLQARVARKKKRQRSEEKADIKCGLWENEKVENEKKRRREREGGRKDFRRKNDQEREKCEGKRK